MTLRELAQPRWILSSLLIAGAALFAIGVAKESSSENVFGVNLESTTLAIFAAIASIALAALTWRLNRRLVLLATVAFAAVFAVFDIAELVHQIQESRSSIAALAAVIALLHIAAAVGAEQRATCTAT